MFHEMKLGTPATKFYFKQIKVLPQNRWASSYSADLREGMGLTLMSCSSMISSGGAASPRGRAPLGGPGAGGAGRGGVFSFFGFFFALSVREFHIGHKEIELVNTLFC